MSFIINVDGISVKCSILFQDVKQNKALCVVDGMPCLWLWQIVRPFCTVLGCYTQLVEYCDRCYTILCQGCTPCAMDFIMSNILCMPPASSVQLMVTCLWLSTGQLLPDLNHARFSQDLHMSNGPSSVGRCHMRSARPWVIRSLFYRDLFV